MIKRERVDLAILLLASLLLSIYLFFRTYVVSLDGAFQYIPIAKDFVSGLYGKALSHNQQPFYSFIIAFVYTWIGDFELAGKLISTLFGILLIFPVYFLGKRIFDQKIAFLSTLFLAIHPYIRRFSADVLKEATYLFFLAGGLWFAWRTIQGERRYPYLFIPLLSVLAYLVRPDGVGILIVVFLYILFFKRFNTPGDRWKVIFLLVLSSFLFFLPYLLHLRETTGVWTLSRAKTIAWFLGLSGSAGEISLIDRVLFTLQKLNAEIFSRYHSLYIFLLVVGLWKRRSSLFKGGEGFLLLFCILHYVVLFLLVLNITEWGERGTNPAVYFSGRHVLPLVLFSIYWVGEGFVVIHHWVCNKIVSSRLFLKVWSKKESMIVWTILFVLIFSVILPKTLKPQRYERLPEKWAGNWIKNQIGKGQILFTTIPRVAYYADGSFERIVLDKERIEKVMGLMRERNILYLVIRERETIHDPEVAEMIKRDFIELHRFEGKGMDGVIVYKRVI
ncbi:MAG: glycosyltransferase family 39 protein [Deltaproteobacteria bacterium]|nr:glycosyltransferase family 39 protein [Deltaproteobacteria bacterium]